MDRQHHGRPDGGELGQDTERDDPFRDVRRPGRPGPGGAGGLLLLAATLLPGVAAGAQTFPSPVFQGVTLQADPATAVQAVRKGYLDSRLATALPTLSTCMLLGGTGAAGTAQGVALGAGLTCSANTLGLAVGAAPVTAANALRPRTVAAMFSDRVNLLDYAVCDGTADDTAAVATALGVAAAIPGGAMLEMPQRQCRLTSTVPLSIGAGRHVHIRGAGGMSGFVTTNGAGIAVTLTADTSGFDASDVAFMQTGTTQAGTALSVQATATQVHTISHFRHLLFSGTGGGSWQVGLKLIGVSAPVVDGMRYLGPDGGGNATGYGLHLTGADTAHYLTDAKVVNSVFQGGQAGIRIDGAVQGAFVANSEAIGNDYGILAVDVDTGGANLIEAVIATNNHFNNTLAGVSLTRVHQNQITNNLFLHFNPAAGRAWQAVRADTSGWNVVIGNGLVGQAALGANAGGERFYETYGTSSFHTVTGNNVVGLVGYCINTSSATLANVSGNICEATTAPGILLGGQSFAVGNRVNGVNALVGTGSAAASVATDLSVTGLLSASGAIPSGAGTTQATATPITAQYSFVGSGVSGSGLRLPARATQPAGTGATLSLYGYMAADQRIYPAAGESLIVNGVSLAANSFGVLRAGGTMRCTYPSDGTTWECTSWYSPDSYMLNGRVAVGTPASSGAACAPGQVMMDAAYAYFCVAANSWRRVATASW